ncbi:MAG: LysR family transcriptional regulator [Pseudomonadales bacterium]
MDWDDLKFVTALAGAGNVRAAGRQLGVHGSTVARRVEQLEQRLGVRLFSRTRAGMRVTEDGRALLDTARSVAEQLDTLEQTLRRRKTAAAGLVRIAAADLLAAALLPGLARLRTREPDIDFELVGGDALQALERRTADVAVVVTEDPPGHLLGRALGEYREAWYGAPAFLDALSDPPEAVVAVAPARPLLALEAARAGLGIARLPCRLGDADERLQRAATPPPVLISRLWLLSSPDLRGVARVQLVAGFLQEYLTEPA